MTYEPDKLKPGEPLYTTDLNPHKTLVRASPKGVSPSLNRCTDCGITGFLKEVGEVACTFVHPPCKWCGNTPVCAWDCAGMKEVFNNPDVYMTGADRD